MKTAVVKIIFGIFLIFALPYLLDVFMMELANRVAKRLGRDERDLKVEWLHDLNQQLNR